MKRTLLHSAILAVLTLSANAEGFKSGVPTPVKQETTQQSVEPLKTEVKDTVKHTNISGSEELKADIAKLLTASEQHQNFIWDQEKINKDQEATNKHQEEVNQKLATTINKSIDSINSINSRQSSNDDYSRLRNRVQDLEYALDRAKSQVNSLESRLNSLERRVR